jgi:5'-3' exoribonuclease 1
LHCRFFPQHYAPYISDLSGIAGFRPQYTLGKPFLPFQQLMGVLPLASKALVPEAFQHLMESDQSPIIDFYPTTFEMDLNGKKNEWEALVLIPFIESVR